MSEEEEEAEIFGFMRGAAAYLEDMASRGDHIAMFLHVVAIGILEEHEEGED